MKQNTRPYTDLLINESAFVQYMNANRYVKITAAIDGPYHKSTSENYVVGSLIAIVFVLVLLGGVV